MEDILKAMQDYDNDPEVKRAAMRHAFIWEDKDDKEKDDEFGHESHS